uniref:Translin associated factor X interacting protein 1 n=1 Tax=Latimeria chalumnae TaxID=7897 RepID=M3XH25_LATCH|nr:PREDICTED: translin-associated factor X-interacting protein 1 [Latimeria chalumnae]|eukprot:XP_014342028.1 PREDICTED: translin-associated factor X-interacting protein 1 [Latimeria chalumnae]
MSKQNEKKTQPGNGSVGEPQDHSGPNTDFDVKKQPHANNTKHPPPLRTIVHHMDSAHLSTWPGHANGLLVLPTRKPNAATELKIHGCEDYAASTFPKPRFLEQLEAYLRKELQALDLTKPNAQELKLQAYREVFEYFIEDFRTYKPLLSAIKNEYDITLAHLREQIRSLEPLKAKLVTVSQQCDQKILALREEEREEIRALKNEKLNLLKIITNVKKDQVYLQAQVIKLQEELSALYIRYREESDARKLLIADINDLRRQKEERKDSPVQAEDKAEDSVKLRLALKVAREDLTKVQMELNIMKADYGDVVPRRDFEILEKKYNDIITKTRVEQVETEQLKQEYDILLEVHQQITHQRDKFSTELEHLKRSSTPRPDWSKCAALIPGGAEEWEILSEGCSSDQQVDVLLAVLGGKIMPQKDFFDGRKGKRSSFPDFFHSFLQKKFPESTVEWAYNIYEGCKVHREDEFIYLFYCILTGKLDEEIYHGQIQLISNLLTEFAIADSSELGTFTCEEFSQTLRTVFPLKTPEQIQKLVEAAALQLGSIQDTVNYKALFMEDEEGKSGVFPTVLRHQQIEEKQAYLQDLKAQFENAEEITGSDLKAAFTTIDPCIEEKTLDTYISQAFPTAKENCEEAGPMSLNIVLQRLQASNINRTGPKEI